MIEPRRSNAARPPGLDSVSKSIIEQLQADGRRSYAEIGKVVGLSEAAVRQRVQKLTDSGVMQIVAVTRCSVAALAVGLWLAEGEAAVWDHVVLRLADVARAVVRRVALARALGEAVAVLRLAPLLRPAALAALPGPGFFPCIRPVRGPPV